MDNTDILQKTYTNMKQIDMFYTGSDYQTLIDMSITATQDSKMVAGFILNQIDLIDESIEFFTDKREWKRCYTESVKLVTLLRDSIDTKYNPA